MARTIEEEGIATVCVMNLRKVAERILAPRTLLVRRPMGAILGAPGDRDAQRAVVLAALLLLADPELEAGEIREFEGG
ncbi:MAG: hypothetical protein PVJ43_07535 [Gemmatimonadales bacterium]